MFSSIFDESSSSNAHSSLEYVLNHVFFSVYSQYIDDTQENAHTLVGAAHAAACAYHEYVEPVQKLHWLHTIKMLDNLQAIIKPTHSPWGLPHWFEALHWDLVTTQLGEMETGDILIIPAITKENSAVILQKQDTWTLYESLPCLLRGKAIGPELAIEIPNQVFNDQSFRLKLTNSFAPSISARWPLTDMLCDVGRPIGPKRITKHVGLTHSPLWYPIRFAIQSSLDRSVGDGAYKAFMLFFMCNLAIHAIDTNVSSVLLHSMSATVLRRFRKLGSSVPQWLRGMVSHTCTGLSRALDERWQRVQVIQYGPSPWDLSRLDLTKDTQTSFPGIHEYILNSLANCGSNPLRTPFLPNSRLRGALRHFLSSPDSFLCHPDGFSHDDIHVTLHDVERAIAEDVDDWVACVTNINEACEQLQDLVNRYQSFALDIYRPGGDTDHLSVMLLTIIEIWVALDKLVIKEIPILSDYSPEVSVDLLSRLLLPDSVSVHRLCRVYQYLLSRHTRAQSGWSVFLDEFTEHSFPCRYYDSHPHLQRLKAHIEATLPTEPLHAKIVVFELQCPLSFDTWCSVTRSISPARANKKQENDTRVRDIPALSPHILAGPRRRLSLFSNPSAPQSWGRLYYVYEGPLLDSFEPVYKLPSGPYARSGLQKYLGNTTHTSNEVLAAHANCDPNICLHEFIAFAHLRSGGSLQWFNILRELRSRALDFRRPEVYLLLAQASAQVGPPESAGELLWHQELQDASFCNVLLLELESLFVDIGVGSLDGPAMATISLLAGVLASRSSRDIMERAAGLLLKVRRKTFEWVYELLYDVRKSSTDEGLELLRDMAAICRSTFNVGAPASYELFRSVQDIEAALSCAMLVRTTVLSTSSGVATYSKLLLDRDRRLSFVLEDNLRDAIQADTTDLGVDRAVQLVWPGYRPSPRRWEPLRSPNTRWLVCETAPTKDRRSQTVHINLLDGSLLVDGGPIGSKLPGDVTSDSAYRELFGDRNLLVVASDLREMDFVTMSPIHGHHVHFAIRYNSGASRNRKRKIVVIRAQSDDTEDVFELIPRKKLQGDLPRSLVEGYIHWLNLSTFIIEARPIQEPWKQSSDNWSIRLGSGQSCTTKGGESLVDKHALTWTMVSNRFQCLDDPENLIVTVSPVDSTQSSSPLRLSVALPRYGLSFFVNEANHLESRDFKDMVYDEDQCIGTLFGLVNRVVLRPKAQIEKCLIPRHILIPYGHPNQRGHNVYVTLSSLGQVRYYTYYVDSELGCLKGIVDLESRLYLAHLHALTGSGCRPDPLTGRTGVEEAISLIWLAGTRRHAHEFLHSEPHGYWCPRSQSPQIRSAFAKIEIQEDLDYRLDLPIGDALLREAYLFPSEVADSVRRPRKEPAESLDQLLYERPAPDLRARNGLPHYDRQRGSGNLSWPNIDPLRQLFSSLRANETASAFQNQYISRLHDSAHHFQTTNPLGAPGWASGSESLGIRTLRKHYVGCRSNYMESLGMIKMALGPETEFERLLDQCGQWPRVTSFTLFRCLASTSPVKLPESWKKCLISLALLALDVQRARRLLRFALDNQEEELSKELENEGCDGWDPAKHPDWLLIQLQGDFFIRRVQADAAKEMMNPRSGKNTVMQVNMGEGKTSVIIPICAASLADGDQLVRVVVPKALIPQTLQLLTERLCGLVNKPVYHLTFSRNDLKVKANHKGSGKVERLHKIVSKCRDECGIVIVQPEHILSLKSACVETQLYENGVETKSTLVDQKQDLPLTNGIGTKTVPVVQKRGFRRVLHVFTRMKLPIRNLHVSSIIRKVRQLNCKSVPPEELVCNEIAETDEEPTRSERPVIMGYGLPKVLELQTFLETHARDILDESDDVLRPQCRLIYAIGLQRPFEGSPRRWIVVQQVLGLLKRHACLLSAPGSHAIRCDSSPPGSFPRLHILKAETSGQLISLITQDVLDGRLSGLSLHSEQGLRGAVREFIQRKDIHPDTAKMVEKYARQSTSWGSLLLLRGLLAHDILLFALTQRRWRVDYGLDLSSPPRSMLAIPYRAKDVPAEMAEFGHPDVTILLTCLSYYYDGLSEEKLRISFELLLQEDDPSSEYALWLEDCDITSVPHPLRKLSGVNIRSFEQWEKYIVPLFTRNKRAIDLYLSKVVFAKHAKEFPQRISGSYWDLAERKNHLVAGLSGTNDGQYLLPTSIAQDDPDHLQQSGANARVLAYLLQQENCSYMVATDENGERWTTMKLLRMVAVQNPQIRVLLDVGAQILDLSNLQLAKAWLDCTAATETAGAIYFDEDDILMVLARDGATQPLSSSPLAQQLHRCVAYLDHAHTRGTDLKFPRGFRAAVTLGPKVTKDRLVQGCMRMRKLGHGHSVMFFAPYEVDLRIRTLVVKENSNTRVTTADILHWAIHETWNDIQQQAPYWAQQGMNHQSRYDAWVRFCCNEATPQELGDTWVQPELKSLADMYIPCHSTDVTSMNLPRRIRDHCANLGVLSLPGASLDEEQEREVSREIEREREVERPPRVSPATHSLHPHIVQFVRTGDIPSPLRSEVIRHVFATGVGVTPGGPRVWSPYMFATADFCETIAESELVLGREGDYLRRVQWVISGKMRGRDALVLVSPFEADRLMPEIRTSERVHLHLYIPRTIKRMKPSDDLRLYSVPPVPPDWSPPWNLIDQLNVFAGQLFLSDYTSYVRLCRFLGVHTEDLSPKAGAVVARNRLGNPDTLGTDIKNRLEGSPLLPHVIELLAARRDVDIAGTHMGRILEGWSLTEEDF